MADEIKIPIFDGKDYECWKRRIEMILKMKKCQEVVSRRRSTTDKEDEWNEKDLKAINVIYSGISNDQLQFVKDKETSYEIMKKFDEMYLKESTALQICVRNKLERLKLKDFKDSTTFFTEFEKIVNELKSAGATVTEKEKLSYMIKMLPSSLSYVGDLVDVLKEDDQTVDFVVSKIKMMELKEDEETSKQSTSVFKTERKKEQNCFKCGKYGHFKAQCTNMKPGGNPWKPKGGMQYRGGGHQQNWQNRGNGNGRYNRGNRGAGQHHRTGSWQQENQEGGMSSFNAEVDLDNSLIEVNNCNDKVEWLLDSGCSDHIINDDAYFYEYIVLKTPVNVRVADGRTLKATKLGTVLHEFSVYGKIIKNKLLNVYYVKEMDKNLISFGKVTKKNKIVSVGNVSKIYNDNGNIIALAYKLNGIYHMTSKIVKIEINNTEKNMTDKEKFHRALGHVNFNYLKTMCEKQMLQGLPKDLECEYFKCGICLKNKMHNLSFKNERSRAKEILEIVHTDLNGPHHNSGINGEKYFLTFIDDFSKVAQVYVIKSKSEVYDCFVKYVNLIENKTDKKIKKLRCDNGTEYLNNNIHKFASEKGIYIEPCPPYVHELNGTAEKYNRDIMDMARCLLDEAKVHNRFWPEVIKTAAYLKNRILTNTIVKDKTPYEIMFGEKPSVEYLKLYGSRVFVRLPEQKRNSKWDRKADLGILLGYENVGYRILVNNKIIVARHVDFIEEGTSYIEFNSEKKVEDVCEIRSNGNEQSESSNDGENDLRRSSREKRKPAKLNDENFVYNSDIVYVNYVNVNIPISYTEAMTNEDHKKWTDAMTKEMNSLMINKTWVYVEKPKDKKILDLKWVYTIKNDEVFKARLVVRGYQQNDFIDDIYSPVARMQSLKILLSYCCNNGLIIYQMDVETAFLNGKIKSEVYVKQPPGFEDGTDKVLKLDKALYGLRESPRAWYDCFDEFLRSLNFRRSKNDNCLYILKEKDNNNVYLILFVDDLLICCKDKGKLNEIKYLLMKSFKMKDLGMIKTYLGININYDYKNGELSLDQTKYIDSLEKKYDLQNSKLFKTPMEQNLKLLPAESKNDIRYRNLIGALLYISSGTRPDISFSVNYLSRFQNCYDDTHYKYALRVLKYLILTKNLKLIFRKNENTEILKCYVDADWAGDINDRKSTTGYVIKMYDNVIFWKSKKQGSVTKSSTSAEYVALSECVSELKIIKDILFDFEIEFSEPIKIFEDNSGAISIAKHGNFTKNSKYIETHFHFVNESYLNQIIDIVKIDSEENIADILTKALGSVKFEKLRKTLGLN